MQAASKVGSDVDEFERAQKRTTNCKGPVAFGADCGMFPFSRGILEFQAMLAAGLMPSCALKAATSVAAELLQREDIGVLAPGKQADSVAMAGDPILDIAVTEKVDFVMKAGRIYRHQAFDVFQS